MEIVSCKSLLYEGGPRRGTPDQWGDDELVLLSVLGFFS